MANEVTTTSDAALAKLDDLSQKAGALVPGGGRFTQAVQVARMLGDISLALDAPGVKEDMLALQGQAYGFLTDKQYTWQQLKPAIIEAVMADINLWGNHLNVIAGRAYATQGHYVYKTGGLEDLKDVGLLIGIPHMSKAGDGAKIEVDIKANWKGTEIMEKLQFAVKCNRGQGADALAGKAKRKALKWLYERCTGSHSSDGEISDAITVDATVTDDPQPTCSESWARCDPPWHADVSSLGPPELVVRALRDRGKAYTSVKQIPADIAAELLVDDAFRAEVSALADLGGQQ